ncbi:MAG: GH85 family endohexosaminidase C-terminal domain-containing protein [Oscillospiraceae bacterium]
MNRFDGTNEIQLAWDLGDYDTVKNYHVYAVYADGTERFVGGAYAANYYIQTLENAESVTALRVRAVGVDGSESAAAESASGIHLPGLQRPHPQRKQHAERHLDRSR